MIGSSGRNFERFADARGVAAEKVQLERVEIGGRDPDFGERPEAGVDAVDGGVAVRLALHHRAGGADPVGRHRRQGDRLAAVGDCHDLFERERRTVNGKHLVRSPEL